MLLPLTLLPAHFSHWQYNLGIFADPIILGDYPDVVKDSAGPLLPAFTPAEKAMLKVMGWTACRGDATPCYRARPAMAPWRTWA